MRSEKEQFPLGMLGQRWFCCESHKHKIHSFNKYLLRFFYIQGTVLGIWDPSVMGGTHENKKTKPKKITALVKVLFQQENQTRSNRHKNPLIQLVIGQLFAYFTATSLKRNIDKPRSLAKSVTVA